MDVKNIKEKGLINLIGGAWWGLNKAMVKALGLETALWLTDLFSKFEYFSAKGDVDKDGFFFNTQEDIRKDTGLGFDKQTSITKSLVGIGVLQVVKKGLPARNYYKIDIEKLSEIIGKWLSENQDPVHENNRVQSPGNPGTGHRGIQGLINKNKGNKNKDNKSTSNEVDNVPNGTLLYSENSSQDKPILRRRKIPLSEKPPYTPKDVKEIINIWVDIGFPEHKNHTSKIYNGTVYSLKKLRRGVFFNDLEVYNDYKDRKFTKEEIVDAIKNFAWFVNNLNFGPTNGYRDKLRKTTLLDFLYNPFAKKDRSLLLKYIDLPPDNHPEMSKILFGSFEGMRRGIGELSVKERAKLVSGSNRLCDFYDKNRKKIYPQFIRTTKDKAELLVDALKDRFADSRIEAGHFCSDYTFNTVLPQYLERQAVLVDENIIG